MCCSLDFGTLQRTDRFHRDGARQFKRCFGHRAQVLSLRTSQDVFSASERTSMQAMLARVTEPVAYQVFQHFITHAPCDAERVWRQLA